MNVRDPGPVYALAFDADACDASIAGGKGASLARLTLGGFPVPTGIVIPADAYRAFIASAPDLAARIGALEPADPERLRDQCSALRAWLASLPVPEAVDDAVRSALRDLLRDDSPVSVRSSATLEDLAGAAFAGQHDTFLNVHGADEVITALRRCWISLWEDRAVRYRHERGFAGRAVSMAVVVQHMIQSDVAGVAFTLDPITGDDRRIVINAAWGLGETVVSGEGAVDQFIVDRNTGRMLDRLIANKTHALVGTDDGTQRVELSAERANAPSLDDAQAAELAALATRAESFYAFPQDIEWALADGRLFLLQSRPITKFPARWTREESAERFPGPVTPLTWDFTTDGFHASLAHSLALMGMPAFEGTWFERFDGYIYGNQTAVRLFTSGRQVAFESLDQLGALLPGFSARYRWVQELPVTWARDLDRYLLALGRLSAVDLDTLDQRALWTHVLAVDAVGRAYFLPNIAISITQGQLHRMLFRLAALVTSPERAPALHDALTGFCDTKTNLVNRNLFALYRIARAEPALASLLRDENRRTICTEQRLTEFPVFDAAFRRFIEDHGHREVDFDAYHPTWAGQPWVVLENLRLMLLREDVADPVVREGELRARQQETERTFLALVPPALRNFAAELLRLARAYTALDDLEHYQTTRLSIPFRAGLVALGERLVARGVLDLPEDIFFLRRATLESFLDDDVTAAEARAEALASRADHMRQLAEAPPHVHGERSAPAIDVGLRGLAGSPGLATGPVCRVFSVDDFARFRPGSVLVARTTNPAWTPLFYSAIAVITESGGPLSHGAVTAREVGVPAVMAVRDALSIFEDGDVVTVDGTHGSITRDAG